MPSPRVSPRVLVHVRRPVGALAILAAQIYHAGHRPDLPSLDNQDPSGTWGADHLPSLRVVFLGDSSVTAPGVHPLDAAWPRVAVRDLSDRYRVEVVSVAVGGSKARDVLEGQVDAAIATEPDVAVVSVGANDALRGVTVARFESAMDEILDRLTAAVPAVGVTGVGDLGPLPRLPALGRGVATVRSRAMDRATARSVSRHPGVLKAMTWGPQWSIFADDPDTAFAADRFHASAMGHAVFGEAFGVVIGHLVEGLEAERSSENRGG